jgi:hypothetical protein
MFQVYDPKRMLVRWAVLDETRLARCNAMARRREKPRQEVGSAPGARHARRKDLPRASLSILGPRAAPKSPHGLKRKVGAQKLVWRQRLRGVGFGFAHMITERSHEAAIGMLWRAS